MNATLTTIILGIFTAVGGGLLASVANGILTRSKTKAEAESTRATAAQIATNTTLAIIKDLRDEIARLAKRLNDAEQESEDAKTRAESAEARAVKAEYDVIILRRGLSAYRRRVEYLTRLLEESGVQVNPWTPPEGIERDVLNG